MTKHSFILTTQSLIKSHWHQATLMSFALLKFLMFTSFKVMEVCKLCVTSKDIGVLIQRLDKSFRLSREKKTRIKWFCITFLYVTA